MRHQMIGFLRAASAAFFVALSSAALAQNSGTVTNHAFALGKGPGVQGFGSLGPCAAGLTVVGAGTADATCGQLGLTTGVTGILPGANGGTNNGFMAFTGPSASLKTFTLPNASDTIATLGVSQTFTAPKGFNDGTLILNGSSSGSATLKGPATGGGTATLFPGSDTIAGLAATQTLTNKTINGGVLSGTLSGTPTLSGANFVTLGNLAQSTAGAQFLGVTGASAGNYAPFTLGSLTALSSPSPTLDLIPCTDHVTGTIKSCTPSAIASAVGSGVTSINGLTGALTGFDSNALAGGAVITSVPTVNSTFCGATAALGGNAFYAFTVGAASGFAANCVLTVVNIDGWASGRGKSLSVSGLTLTNPILYPGQIVKFRSINNAWVQDAAYQFAQAPLGQKLYVDIANGNDGNDCLATGSGNACQNIGHVVMGVIWGQLLATSGSATGGSPGFDVRLATDSSCVTTTGVGCYAGLHFSGAPKQIEGFDSIMVECDGGSATNCTIADNTGNCALGVFNASINLEIKNVTLAGGSGNNCLIEATAGQVRVESGVVFAPTGSTSTAQLQADGNAGRIIVEGGNTVTVAAGTSGYLGSCSGGGFLGIDQATFSFAGNVTYGQQTLAANSPCILSATSVTWTLNSHTVTSSHNINAANGGWVITGGASASVPGTNSPIGTNTSAGSYN